jgi:putative peptidoglycan lipid II flippase
VLVAAAVAIWFLVRYPPPLQTLALALIPALALHLVLVALSFLLTALLNASHRFLAAPLASALAMGTTLAVLAATRTPFGVRAIPWAQLAGELVSVAALLVFLVTRAGLRFRPSLRLPDPVRRFLRQMPAHLGGQAITRLNPLVDQLFAGLAAAAGGTTLLKLSGDVAGGPTALLQAALLPVLLSHLSEHVAHGDLLSFRRQVRRTAATVFLVMAAVTAGLVLLRGPALRLLYLRGAMTPAAVEAMQPILVAHVAGLPGFGVLLVLARAHIAAGNTRIMVSMGALNAGMNLALNALLVGPLGLPGIALATSVTNALVAVVFWVRLRPLLSANDQAAAA